MKIFLQDGCAWFEPGYEPTKDERKVLAAVTAALPDALPTVEGYELVAEGSDYKGLTCRIYAMKKPLSGGGELCLYLRASSER